MTPSVLISAIGRKGRWGGEKEIRVRAKVMTLCQDSIHRVLVCLIIEVPYVFAIDEESRFDVVVSKEVEDALGVEVGSVIEGYRDDSGCRAFCDDLAYWNTIRSSCFLLKLTCPARWRALRGCFA